MSSFIDKPMRDALIGTIYQRMAHHPDWFFLSADMGAPALDDLRADFPDRFINVGIAEQNLINVASGLAMEGFTVFTYAIAPFYMRAFEQIRINLALATQSRPMNVNMLALGAGLSYDVSGPTHHCLEDLTIMRALPHIVPLSPADSVTALAIADFAPKLARPKYIRLDGKVFASVRDGGPDSVDMNRGYAELRRGDSVCIVSTGFMVHEALKVAARFPGRVSVVDVFRFDDDVDLAGLRNLIGRHQAVLTVEEGFVNRGGLDAFVAAIDAGRVPHTRFGMKSEFDYIPGSRAAIHARNGLAVDDVARAVAQVLEVDVLVDAAG